MSEIYDKFHDLGAFVNGGQPRRTVPMPAPSIPKPAVPTVKMVIDGMEVEPASRLSALASIRDRHRAAARFASDRTHSLREQIIEREQTIRLIAQRAQLGFEAEVEAQTAILEAEILQLRAAMATANDEATTAAEAAGAADRLFRAARDFAVQHGATLPITISAEVLK